MASHDYYGASPYTTHPPSYEQAIPPRVSPVPSHAGADIHNPYTTHDSPSSDPHHNNNNYLRYSQQSLASDNGAYLAGGRQHDGDQYAENIPLKAAHQQQYGNAWMQQPTGYHPGPPPEMGMGEPPVRGGRKKKKGFFQKKIAWVTYTLTVVQIVVFIVELVKMGQLTGSPIQTKPQFNPMIGPSAYLQINMGSRYTPCMKNIDGLQNAEQPISFPCPNTTTGASDCQLSDLCGFSGVPNPVGHQSLDHRPQPNQWFRFIIPMFLHSGFIHIGFNLLVQMTMGVDMERMIGWWRYGLVYLASGIWGFVLGGNYAAQLEASCGCSGALFGILALFILDLFYTWNERQSPWVELIIMILGIAVSFVLGLLPGLDNFSHIGGFVMGLALGLCLLRSPNALRERIGLARTPYVAMSGAAGSAETAEENKVNKGTGLVDFFKGKGMDPSIEHSKNPVNFFRGRKPLWWAWWLVRAGALVAVIIGFIFLIVDFYKYYSSNCDWCYRLSCLPVKNWCSQNTIQSSLTKTTSSSTPAQTG